MEEILRAVHPAKAVLGQDEPKNDHTISQNEDGKESRGGPAFIQAENVECLRAIKNALVGNDGAKQAVLRLGIVGKLLSSLDATSTGGDGDSAFLHESTAIHAMGIFAILTTTESRGDSFTPCAVLRVVEHIAHALASPNERLQTTALRALTELSISGVIAPPAKLAHAEMGGTNSKLSEALTRVAQLVLEKVAGNHGADWMPNVKTLALEALAALTRDRELARGLGPSVVSTGTALIGPILPAANR